MPSPSDYLRRKLPGNQMYPTQQMAGVRAPNGLAVSNQVKSMGDGFSMRNPPDSYNLDRPAYNYTPQMQDQMRQWMEPDYNPPVRPPAQMYQGGYSGRRAGDFAVNGQMPRWMGGIPRDAILMNDGPQLPPNINSIRAQQYRSQVPSLYGNTDRLGTTGNANGYVSGQYQTPIDYGMRQWAQHQVYNEQMAPSQLGPYGALGGSSGRGAMMGQLAQQQQMPQAPMAGPAWDPNLMAQIQQQRRQVAPNASGRMVDGYGVPVDPATGQHYQNPETGGSMWMSPGEFSSRMQNRQAQLARMAEASKQRKMQHAERLVRRQYGGALPSELSQFMGGGKAGGPNGGPAATGYGDPGMLPQDATPEQKQANLEAILGSLDPNSDPQAIRQRLGQFSDEELQNVLDENTGWFMDTPLTTWFGDFLDGPGHTGIDNVRKRREMLRRVLGQQPQQQSGPQAPVGAPAMTPEQKRQQFWLNLGMGNVGGFG